MPESASAAKRILYMMKEIVGVNLNGHGKISQREFCEHFVVDPKTIRRDMQWFIENKLITSSRGYKPTNRFVIFFNHIKDMDKETKNPKNRLFPDN